ncbi:hypothetical protein ACE3NQ_30360 [Paenibacillus terreus]|uniref:Acid phosphatase n=1 Tax=Paenibacillus terreus TaxID=1387834 RepID=A0ABV5BHM0_9BACL
MKTNWPKKKFLIASLSVSVLLMAYAVPERYQELLTRASGLGNNRIVAGMHSPFDVMGGAENLIPSKPSVYPINTR